MKCEECLNLDKVKKECRGFAKGPLRKCLQFLTLYNFGKIIKPGYKVLEVGCGYDDFAKVVVEDLEGLWFGIDPQEVHGKGRKSIRTHKGQAGRIPFESNYFDFVYANQSMEHWRDFGDEICHGISEIYRVLKKDKCAMINVPIHLHGDKIFIEGNIQTIENYFLDFNWKEIDFQEWRKEYKPLSPCYVWKKSRERKPDRYKNVLENSSSWILNVICKK